MQNTHHRNFGFRISDFEFVFDLPTSGIFGFLVSRPPSWQAGRLPHKDCLDHPIAFCSAGVSPARGRDGRTTIILQCVAGKKPRSGDRFIAWGVSPRNSKCQFSQP